MIDASATVNGLTIGKGSVYEWREWPTGLGTPEIRVDDRQRPRRHGATAGADLFGTRSIAFEIQVNGSSLADIEDALTALSAAFEPRNSDAWLDLRVSGSPAEYSLRGRVRGCEWDLSRRFTFGLGDARCLFVATDPLKYGPAVSTTIALGVAGPGFVLPRSLPGVLGGSSTSGVGSCPNSGRSAVEWSAVLVGPLTNPRIEDIESGRFLKLNATIGAGETVVLDSLTGAVLLGGSAARPGWLGPGSRWWQLDPGANSIRLVVDAGSGSIAINYRPGWA